MLCGSAFLQRCLVELGVPASKLRVHYVGVPIPELTSVDSGRGADTEVRLVAVSRLAAVPEVAEAEINPLIVHAEGQGVTVADAWVVRA